MSKSKVPRAGLGRGGVCGDEGIGDFEYRCFYGFCAVFLDVRKKVKIGR